MLTVLTGLVPYDPIGGDPVTDGDRATFLCRSDQPGAEHPSGALHVACSGELSARVLSTIRAGDRVALTGSVTLVTVERDGDDEGSVRLDIEATDVRRLK